MGTISSAFVFPAIASALLASSLSSNLLSAESQLSLEQSRDDKSTHTPCSKNFLTFHMVMSAVGEDEIMMIGLFDLAFRAPRDESAMSRGQKDSSSSPADAACC